MPLVLPRRAAKLGNSLTCNAQRHGKDSVAALYINFSELPIIDAELPELMLDRDAYKYFYRKTKGRPDEPRWKDIFAGVPIMDKIPGWEGTLFLGRHKLKFADATVKSAYCEFAGGGVSQLKFQLQWVPEMDETHPIMEALLVRVNQKIDIELSCESYGAEPELPLEEKDDAGDPDGEDDDTEPEMSNMGRRISRATRRKNSDGETE